MCRLQVLAGMTLVLLLLLQADCARHCCNATSSKLVDEMHPAIKTQALAVPNCSQGQCCCHAVPACHLHECNSPFLVHARLAALLLLLLQQHKASQNMAWVGS
jgi:hypothetical protein